MSVDIVTILGPTASGKTRIAAQVAYYIDGEVISADSRQVYRYMNIGTGKDLQEYFVHQQAIPYHLIDIVDAGEKYNVYQYKKDFYLIYEQIKKKNKVPILCGGSGMYLEAILRNYPLVEVPENKELRQKLQAYTLEELTTLLKQYKEYLHNKTDIDTKKRAIRAIEIAEYYKTHNVKTDNYPSLKSLTIGIFVPREVRRQRISHRLKERLANGMIEEVKILLTKLSPEDLMYYGLEYKYITEYLLGNYSYEEFFKKLEVAIHQFAKRQMTYFRGMERRGVSISWIDGTKPIEDIVNQIVQLYKQHKDMI